MYFVCPVSNKYINATAARVNAVYTLILLALNMFFGYVYISIFLVVDFFIKAFLAEYFKSPLSYLSSITTKILNLPFKKKNMGQKMFAARIGMFMSLLIASFGYYKVLIGVYVASGIFMSLVLLEALTGFCMGCYLYSLCLAVKNKLS